MGKMVSVIVPVYNMQQYLAETLDSILATTYPYFEVVVVDDGSKDGSYQIAKSYEAKDGRIRAFTKPNGGVSTARNLGISKARGEFILPVDADNTIEPDFIEKAVEVMEKDPEVKVVAPTSDYFGEKTGLMKLPSFTLSYLARENSIDNCALYRKADWERVGGYNTEITTREDWAFWISILKNGGKVVRLQEVLHHYRARANSKRIAQRCNKYKVIDKLNQLHPEFFERELNGHLHHMRSWSRTLNTLARIFNQRNAVTAKQYSHLSDEARALPAYFHFSSGKLIKKDGQEEVMELRWKDMDVVAKSFSTPWYTFKRSETGRMFKELADQDYTPVAYCEEYKFFLLVRSYCVYLKNKKDKVSR